MMCTSILLYVVIVSVRQSLCQPSTPARFLLAAETKDWNGAVQFCLSNNARLAHLDTPGKIEAVGILSPEEWMNNKKSLYWIGLHHTNSRQTDDTWTNCEKLEFYNFGTAGDVTRGHYCVAGDPLQHTWSHANCTARLLFICEQQTGPSCTINEKVMTAMGTSEYVGRNLTTVHQADCEKKCLEFTENYTECWVYTYHSATETCLLHIAIYFSGVQEEGNFVRSKDWILGRKVCFSGEVIRTSTGAGNLLSDSSVSEIPDSPCWINNTPQVSSFGKDFTTSPILSSTPNSFTFFPDSKTTQSVERMETTDRSEQTHTQSSSQTVKSVIQTTDQSSQSVMQTAGYTIQSLKHTTGVNVQFFIQSTRQSMQRVIQTTDRSVHPVVQTTTQNVDLQPVIQTTDRSLQAVVQTTGQAVDSKVQASADLRHILTTRSNIYQSLPMRDGYITTSVTPHTVSQVEPQTTISKTSTTVTTQHSRTDSTSIDVKSIVMDQITTAALSCSCECLTRKSEGYSLEDLHRLLAALDIPKHNLSSTRRRLTSAPDARMSSVTCGILAICILTVTFGGVLLSDLMKFMPRKPK